jgi:hypothetical protein
VKHDGCGTLNGQGDQSSCTVGHLCHAASEILRRTLSVLSLTPRSIYPKPATRSVSNLRRRGATPSESNLGVCASTIARRTHLVLDSRNREMQEDFPITP